MGMTVEGNVTIAAVNGTSVRQPLPASANQNKQIRFYNPTNGIVYFKLGDSTVAAAVTDFPVAGSATNPRINFVMEITGGENREAGGLYLQMNYAGYGTATITNTLLGTYYTLEGAPMTVYSNYVSINWVS